MSWYGAARFFFKAPVRLGVPMTFEPLKRAVRRLADLTLGGLAGKLAAYHLQPRFHLPALTL
ncbi:MAG: hypothetical protein H7273_07215 [Polaromonas sp.]|nr:hypothetical protein [Polaromonas sp.]